MRERVYASSLLVPGYREPRAARLERLMSEMPERPPLVTVVTPVMPSRTDLLVTRCIPSVRDQDYPSIQHVIVSDGHSPDVMAVAQLLGITYTSVPWTPVRHWGAAHRRQGITQAQGEIICYLDDDDEFMSDHVSTMVRLLKDNPQAGWAYAAVDWHREKDTRYTWSSPPGPENCSSILAHHKSLPAPWRDGPREDWDLITTWLEAGVPWATDSRVTADAYAHE